MSISFPGYVPDVAPGGPVADDWGNAVRDRALQVFDNSTDRNAAITVPKVGQACYLTTTGELLIYAGATDGWTKPWNTPWGLLARDTREADALTLGSGGTSDITGLTLSVTLHANRWTKVSMNIPLIEKNTTGYVKIWITEGANDKRELIFNTDMLDGKRAAASGFMQANFDAGTYTFKGQVNCSAGSADLLASSEDTGDPSAMIIMVEDQGPDGNPS